MRKISAWVAIAGFSTLIAGVYGMNFEHMPELGWRYGYFVRAGADGRSSVRALPPVQEVRLALTRRR